MKFILISLVLFTLFITNTMTTDAQQGSTTSGGDAIGEGGEFSYSIGQADYLFYFSFQGSLELGLQHAWQENLLILQCSDDIPDNIVYSYESLCYNAIESLTIAGDGNQFIVESGGNVNLIAGKSIFLKSGTSIKPGGRLHAWITTDGSYCTDTITNVIPCTLDIPNLIVQPNETLCFSAFETVIVAGDGKYFIVEPGAHVDIVAGQSILFRDGTTIKSGGSLHAWITTDGNYCSDSEKLHETIVEKEIPVKQINELDQSASLFKVYPNPTTGEFTLELLVYNEFSVITVEIFTLLGLPVSETQLPAGRIFKFSLNERQPGIYLIRVLKDRDVSITKIIKQ